ncbi:MAM and LDL-receptor class A domain-containing protein 1-like isoform X1 [Limulus polyphemus]|uniref:MAM and LDL-receptor class A domain-containing protein 1-like isoform X1 n=2 Tax=Limulus polyphemus TaxID=6850 RepID=A0ABM1B0U5_LIMPO|nr:MAM and LDL-receptor class A domain-containing protein 1-like isoform X1 [Limulus polyphemus]
MNNLLFWPLICSWIYLPLFTAKTEFKTKMISEPELVIWTEWTSWSKCTVTCGHGLQYRRRECVSHHSLVSTSFGIAQSFQSLHNSISNCPQKMQNQLQKCSYVQCPILLKPVVFCQPPVQVLHGEIQGETKPVVGSYLGFSCKNGFKLIGPDQVRCLRSIDGTARWSAPIPACLPTKAAPVFCSFDNDWCDLQQEQEDDFDWKRQRGQTSSMHTGPKSDHTSSNYPGSFRGTGYYIYTETSTPRIKGEKARLMTPWIAQTETGFCLKFWYHMYGSSVGSLRVFIQLIEENGAVEETKYFDKTGNHGDFWLETALNIPISNTEIRVIFEGVVGADIYGDIALDDIFLEDHQCIERINYQKSKGYRKINIKNM